MAHAIGLTVHTGWSACVVVAGSLARPQIIANQIIHLLDDSERFCFHMAAEMQRAAAEKWLAQARKKATANAQRAFSALHSQSLVACAIVAKDGVPGDLDAVLASHPRLHTAEGCFYRDALRDACPVPVRVIPPATLDPSKLGKLAPAPWGRDQKLATLAAFRILGA